MAVCLYYDAAGELRKVVHADKPEAHDEPGLTRVELDPAEYAKLGDVRLLNGRAFAYAVAQAALARAPSDVRAALQSKIDEADAARALEERRERERQETLARA